MRVVVVGSGAREHAIVASLVKDHEVVATPGNPGIEEICEVTDKDPESIDADLFVIGPEVPLVAGLADRLRANKKLVFGPGQDGAALEGSKAFMKQVLHDAKVPTASFSVFSEFKAAKSHLMSYPGPYVIKTDGLAAGKGVKVTSDLDEAIEDVRLKLSGASFGESGKTVVIEEAMIGPEVSMLVVTDGTSAVALPVATDFKRVYDDDLGENTGGMGAHSPVPWADQSVVDEVMQRAIYPTLSELARRGIDYRGVLYAGLMMTEVGPKLVEYNVRFGDPEAQVVLPRITSDLGQLMAEVASGRIESPVTIDKRAALTVVLASRGYPASPQYGMEIKGIDAANGQVGVTVFHGGTKKSGRGLVSSGGRVLSVTALGDSLNEARDAAYRAVSMIEFEGMHYRRDIGLRAISEGAKSSGVVS